MKNLFLILPHFFTFHHYLVKALSATPWNDSEKTKPTFPKQCFYPFHSFSLYKKPPEKKATRMALDYFVVIFINSSKMSSACFTYASGIRSASRLSCVCVSCDVWSFPIK